MRLAKTVYTDTVKMLVETVDVGRIAKLIESEVPEDNKIALCVLHGGLFYEVCSVRKGLYTKVKELSVVDTPRGPRLAQATVILDGNVADGGYRGKAYRVSTPMVLEYSPGKLDMATVFTGENLALYFEIQDTIDWDVLAQLNEIFEEAVK